MSKLAIIGASKGQLPICIKAREMGHETICFAWEEGAVCKDVVDHYYPISIFEMDKIVGVCRQIGIEGVVSNASDTTAEVVSYVAEQLQLNGTPYKRLLELHNKYLVRSLTKDIEDLYSPRYYIYKGKDEYLYPCVVKPCVGGAKKGVSYVADKKSFEKAINYASGDSSTDIIVEEFVEGQELSVESISYKGHHYIIQITDKDSSSAPHFVELGHHQPAQISDVIKEKISKIIPVILTKIGYTNGASHVEMKYKDDNLFLIEANLRGGGDDISNRLVFMSSGVDYLKCMIDVALDTFTSPKQEHRKQYAGIYYLCKQTSYLLPFFEKARGKEWVADEQIYSKDLKESHSNYERNGYLLYISDHKIIPLYDI